MTGRIRVALAIMLTVLVVFTARLMYLQLVMAQEYEALSTQNFMLEERISPLRGRILARDGTVLADNRIAYDLMYHGGPIENWERLAYLLNLEEQPRQPDPARRGEMENGVVVAWNVPDRLVPALEELLAGQGRLYLRERIERTYPTNLAAQVVGYTTLADPVRFPGYATDELVGVMGIEAGLERDLFGAAGAKLVEVDNRRSVLQERELVPAQPGRDVVLTIDPQVNRWAEETLAGALPYINSERTRWGLERADTVRGALLALDPRTGEILAMASAPTFDQNTFTRRPSDPDEVNLVLGDSVNLPLQNRAVQAYPPASIFKVLTSSTLLEKGYTTPAGRYECPGRITYGGIVWENWVSYYRGNYTTVEAIADSCNTYYWNAAIDTPDFSKGWAPFIRDLVARSREFGFGSPLGIGLPEEKAGRIPDENWKRQATGEPWYPGFTLNTAIGQGDVLSTPLQVLQFGAALAMDGRFTPPHLVRQVGDRQSSPPETVVAGNHWNTLREGMRRMITDYGSSRVLGPAAQFPVQLAGKTGTAENGKQVGMEHSWFLAYGPIDDPEIVVVVFIENGGYSSSVGVPLVRDFLERYWGL
jgi:penicillin-binding protein 2